jgi:hypothetical protein
MASIGSLSGFTGWTGRLFPANRRIAALPPRPGVDGEARVYDGWGSQPSQVVTRKAYADLAAAQTDIATARGMMDGGTESVTDPVGQTWTVVVLAVAPEVFQIQASQILLQLTWTMQVEAAP